MSAVKVWVFWGVVWGGLTRKYVNRFPNPNNPREPAYLGVFPGVSPGVAEKPPSHDLRNNSVNLRSNTGGAAEGRPLRFKE